LRRRRYLTTPSIQARFFWSGCLFGTIAFRNPAILLGHPGDVQVVYPTIFVQVQIGIGRVARGKVRQIFAVRIGILVKVAPEGSMLLLDF
jgi:hypothetical protein